MAVPFLKSVKKSFLRLLLLTVLLFPVGMWAAWYMTARRKFVIAVIDKTVLTKKGQEHISLSWILNQEKFARNHTELYQPERDYFGFFPLGRDSFRLKGLERFNTDALQQLSKDADAAYLTDAYGVYSNEWYQKGNISERSGLIYGGMSVQDLQFLQFMQDRHKLIIAEFNCLGSPTEAPVRRGFERSFGVYWSGWVGRYFDSFDTTTNKELPPWLVRDYRRQHNGSWPFRRGGVAFVHSDDRIVILEKEKDLQTEFPYMFAGPEGQDYYGIPAHMRYTYWFDVVRADTSFNHVIARFELAVTEKGGKELRENGLPSVYPAVIAHVNRDYRFFYLAGDFCDNPIGLTTSYFKGIHCLQWFLYNKYDPLERRDFFWRAYRPLVTTILEDYYHQRIDSTHLGNQSR